MAKRAQTKLALNVTTVKILPKWRSQEKLGLLRESYKVTSTISTLLL